MSTTYPDSEGITRDALKADTDVTAIAGNRVFFGIPKRAVEATYPMVVVFRVGGGQAPGDAPLDDALVQIDCWGSLDAQGNGLKAQCTALVNAVRSSLEAMGTEKRIAGVELGVNVESVLWLPDPDNARPRYSITAEVAAIAA